MIKEISVSAGANSLLMPDSDARKYRRFDVKLTGYVIPVPLSNPDDAAWDIYKADADPILAVNLSLCGAYFWSPVYFGTDEVLWISLLLGNDVTTLRGLVVHSKKLSIEQELYGIGVRFAKSALAEQSIASILEYLGQRH